MLGRHHISISLATIFPFIVPIIFYHNSNLVLAFSFLIAVFIGSLLPDADCGGNSTLHYKFPAVDNVMKKIFIAVILKAFNTETIRKRIRLEVKNEHRGILHSPLGIFLVSIFLTFIVFLIMLIVQHINFPLLVLVFGGLFTGQFFHLLEDSCTVSGINWKFPFGSRELRGRIYTFEKEKGKKDIRPSLYQYILWSISVILLLLYSVKNIDLNILIIYIFLIVFIVLIWTIFIYLSNTEWKFWYWKIDTIKRIKRLSKHLEPSKRSQREIFSDSSQLLFFKKRNNKKNNEDNDVPGFDFW